MNTSKICVTCGAAFKRSPNDYTVRCPDCRAGRTNPIDVRRCVVCNDERYITSRRADGTMERSGCYRCNPDH